jgi:hypothetical protein
MVTCFDRIRNRKEIGNEQAKKKERDRKGGNTGNFITPLIFFFV